LPWETPREKLDKLRTNDRKSWKGRGEERRGEERRDFSRCHKQFTLETQMILAWQICSKSPLE